MNPLCEAQLALENYCCNKAEMLEQALESYCNASVKQEKETLIVDVKNHSSHLVLLEPFYCHESDGKPASHLLKLCNLLGNEDYLENDEEQVQLLTKIFQEIAQLPISVKR